MIEAISLMVECNKIATLEPKTLNDAVLWKPLIRCMRLVVVNIGGLDEPKMALTASAVVLIHAVEIEGVAIPLKLKICSGSRRIPRRRSAAIPSLRGTLHPLTERGPALA